VRDRVRISGEVGHPEVTCAHSESPGSYRRECAPLLSFAPSSGHNAVTRAEPDQFPREQLRHNLRPTRLLELVPGGELPARAPLNAAPFR
jgi:hypothetical protein